MVTASASEKVTPPEPGVALAAAVAAMPFEPQAVQNIRPSASLPSILRVFLVLENFCLQYAHDRHERCTYSPENAWPLVPLVGLGSGGAVLGARKYDRWWCRRVVQRLSPGAPPSGASGAPRAHR